MSALRSAEFQWKIREQWVSRVIDFSPEYHERQWSPEEIIGPFQSEKGRDLFSHWTQSIWSDHEYLVVEFCEEMYPERVKIYEIKNAGAIVKISGRRNSRCGRWETIWEKSKAEVLDEPRILTIDCDHVSKRVIKQIRLDIDCSEACSWSRIVGIQLIGFVSQRRSAKRELFTHLADLFNNDFGTDVTFRCDDGQQIKSHRNILEQRSFYFRQLFEQCPSTDTNEIICIENISSDCFRQILRFIYTNRLQTKLNYQIYLELMRKSNEFHLCSIYRKSLKILASLITKDNVLNIFSESNDNRNPLDEINRLCMEFIEKNRRDIYHPVNMQQLTKPTLLKLIELVSNSR